MFAHREMPFKLPAFLHEGFFHCLNLLSHFSQLVIHGGYILIKLCKRVHDAKQSKQLHFNTLKIRLTAYSIMKLTMWVGSSHYAVNVIFFFFLGTLFGKIEPTVVHQLFIIKETYV